MPKPGSEGMENLVTEVTGSIKRHPGGTSFTFRKVSKNLFSNGMRDLELFLLGPNPQIETVDSIWRDIRAIEVFPVRVGGIF